jgi:nitrogen regulatory protein PII
MRMIVAIIWPDMLEAVKESLDPSEFSMIVSEVKVREAREKVTQIYRGIKYSRDLLPKLRVNIRVNDEDVGKGRYNSKGSPRERDSREQDFRYACRRAVRT